VVGANRYRNQTTTPGRLRAQRIPYYQALKLPLEADRFIANLRRKCERFVSSMPACRAILASKSAGANKEAWITVTRVDLSRPAESHGNQSRTLATWPMTSLLDMLKEATSA